MAYFADFLQKSALFLILMPFTISAKSFQSKNITVSKQKNLCSVSSGESLYSSISGKIRLSPILIRLFTLSFLNRPSIPPKSPNFQQIIRSVAFNLERTCPEPVEGVEWGTSPSAAPLPAPACLRPGARNRGPKTATDFFHHTQFTLITNCPFHFISKYAHTYCIYNSFLEREEEISKIVMINKTVF